MERKQTNNCDSLISVTFDPPDWYAEEHVDFSILDDLTADDRVSLVCFFVPNYPMPRHRDGIAYFGPDFPDDSDPPFSPDMLRPYVEDILSWVPIVELVRAFNTCLDIPRELDGKEQMERFVQCEAQNACRSAALPFQDDEEGGLLVRPIDYASWFVNNIWGRLPLRESKGVCRALHFLLVHKKREEARLQRELEAEVAASTDTGQADFDANRPENKSAISIKGVFRKVGEQWELAFGADAFYLGNSKGLQHIHLLLQSPDIPLPPRKILSDPLPEVREEWHGEVVTDWEAASVTGESGIRKSDEQTLAEVREEIRGIEADLENSCHNPMLTKELEDRRAELFLYLRQVTDHRGKPRLENNDDDKRKKRVSGNIDNAFKKIEQKSVGLGNYLRGTIGRRGGFCYHPCTRPERVDWELD